MFRPRPRTSPSLPFAVTCIPEGCQRVARPALRLSKGRRSAAKTPGCRSSVDASWRDASSESDGERSCAGTPSGGADSFFAVPGGLRCAVTPGYCLSGLRPDRQVMNALPKIRNETQRRIICVHLRPSAVKIFVLLCVPLCPLWSKKPPTADVSLGFRFGVACRWIRGSCAPLGLRAETRVT